MTDREAKALSICIAMAASRYDVYWWSTTYKAWIISGMGYRTVGDACWYVYQCLNPLIASYRRVVVVDIVKKRMVWTTSNRSCNRKLPEGLRKRVEKVVGPQPHNTPFAVMVAAMTEAQIEVEAYQVEAYREEWRME